MVDYIYMRRIIPRGVIVSYIVHMYMANLSQVYQYPRGGTAAVESYCYDALQMLQLFSGFDSSLSYMDEYWQMRLT